MAAKRAKRPNLVVPKADAIERLRAHIDRGAKIRNRNLDSGEALIAAWTARQRWSHYGAQLLAQILDDTSIAAQFEREEMEQTLNPDYIAAGFSLFGPAWDAKARYFRRHMDDSLQRLEAIVDRVALMPEPKKQATPSGISQESTSMGRDVFVVHGHDEAAKESVARFIEKLGLRAIILHEQPNVGRTIIEKFEEYSNVGYAVILLTPDDVGAPVGKPKGRKPRARQNVIFELGYFVCRLGRNRVCALYKEGIEIPSDFQGVLYVPMDEAGAWRQLLAREIRGAGIEIDLNKAF